MMFQDIKNGRFYLGECLEIMKTLPDNCIDMILCDLPYGTTRHKWDAVIAFEPMWEQYNRICKNDAAMCFTASQPFASALVCSNIENFKYEWIWRKNTGSGFANAKNQPLRYHEVILIFSNGKIEYKPQPTKRLNESSEKAHRVPHKNKPKVGNHGEGLEAVSVQYDPLNKNPESVLEFASVPNSGGGKLHPTQKPVPLFEYLIKTYSNEGDCILDNCAGSGTTGIAAENTKRKFVCIEQDNEYANIAIERIKAHEVA